MARGAPFNGSPAHTGTHYELRFRLFSAEENTLSFPCDQAGHVDLDALSDADRIEYLYARALVGREFHAPAVHAEVIVDVT